MKLAATVPHCAARWEILRGGKIFDRDSASGGND